MRATKRKTFIGRVVSDHSDKTIVIRINTYKAHKLYGKRFKYSKKLAAHDQNNEAKIGDKVLIMSTRPYSKTKTFTLSKILEKRMEK